jgi:aspartyl-tRNA synthetase
MLRTHHLGQLNKDLAGEEVVLSAWVQYFRKHGSLIFLNLRDHYGLVQVKLDKDSFLEAFS